MTESSFTDLIVNQPVLMWSLAGGLSILVIAIFLGIFLSVRSRAKQKQASENADRPKRRHVPETVEAAVSELKALAEEENSSMTMKMGEGTAVKTVAPHDTSPAPDAGESPGSFLSLNPGDEAAEEDLDLDFDLEISGEQSPESENTGLEESGNELAALFQEDVIVDPYVQALRDNLPEITIEELLTNVRAVANELQEQINAGHVA